MNDIVRNFASLPPILDAITPEKEYNPNQLPIVAQRSNIPCTIALTSEATRKKDQPITEITDYSDSIAEWQRYTISDVGRDAVNLTVGKENLRDGLIEQLKMPKEIVFCPDSLEALGIDKVNSAILSSLPLELPLKEFLLHNLHQHSLLKRSGSLIVNAWIQHGYFVSDNGLHFKFHIEPSSDGKHFSLRETVSVRSYRRITDTGQFETKICEESDPPFAEFSATISFTLQEDGKIVPQYDDMTSKAQAGFEDMARSTLSDKNLNLPLNPWEVFWKAYKTGLVTIGKKSATWLYQEIERLTKENNELNQKISDPNQDKNILENLNARKSKIQRQLNALEKEKLLLQAPQFTSAFEKTLSEIICEGAELPEDDKIYMTKEELSVVFDKKSAHDLVTILPKQLDECLHSNESNSNSNADSRVVIKRRQNSLQSVVYTESSQEKRIIELDKLAEQNSLKELPVEIHPLNDDVQSLLSLLEKIDLRDPGAILSFVEKTLNPYIQKQYDCRKFLADEKRDALIACLASENLSSIPLELIQKIHQIQKFLLSPPVEAVKQYLAERNEIPEEERIKFTGWLLCGGIRDLEAACIAHGRSEDTSGLLTNALSEDYPEAIIKMGDLIKRTKGLSQAEIEKYIDSLSVLEKEREQVIEYIESETKKQTTALVQEEKRLKIMYRLGYIAQNLFTQEGLNKIRKQLSDALDPVLREQYKKLKPQYIALKRKGGDSIATADKLAEENPILVNPFIEDPIDEIKIKIADYDKNMSRLKQIQIEKQKIQLVPEKNKESVNQQYKNLLNLSNSVPHTLEGMQSLLQAAQEPSAYKIYNSHLEAVHKLQEQKKNLWKRRAGMVGAAIVIGVVFGAVVFFTAGLALIPAIIIGATLGTTSLLSGMSTIQTQEDRIDTKIKRLTAEMENIKSENPLIAQTADRLAQNLEEVKETITLQKAALGVAEQAGKPGHELIQNIKAHSVNADIAEPRGKSQEASRKEPEPVLNPAVSPKGVPQPVVVASKQPAPKLTQQNLSEIRKAVSDSVQQPGMLPLLIIARIGHLPKLLLQMLPDSLSHISANLGASTAQAPTFFKATEKKEVQKAINVVNAVLPPKTKHAAIQPPDSPKKSNPFLKKGNDDSILGNHATLLFQPYAAEDNVPLDEAKKHSPKTIECKS